MAHAERAPGRNPAGHGHVDPANPRTDAAATAGAADVTDGGKALAQLQDRASRARCAVHRLAGGGYRLTLTATGLSRDVDTLHEVAQVLTLIEGS